jgi:hypothetical protein
MAQAHIPLWDKSRVLVSINIPQTSAMLLLHNNSLSGALWHLPSKHHVLVMCVKYVPFSYF